MENYRSAGIIPYARARGDVFFLLGREIAGKDKKGRWGGIGGRKEHNETPIQTAAREAFEETAGFFAPSVVKMEEWILRNYTCHITISDGLFVFYFVEIPYQAKIQQQFQTHLTQTEKKIYHELDSLSWFRFSTLCKVYSRSQVFTRRFSVFFPQISRNSLFQRRVIHKRNKAPETSWRNVVVKSMIKSS